MPGTSRSRQKSMGTPIRQMSKGHRRWITQVEAKQRKRNAREVEQLASMSDDEARAWLQKHRYDQP